MELVKISNEKLDELNKNLVIISKQVNQLGRDFKQIFKQFSIMLISEMENNFEDLKNDLLESENSELEYRKSCLKILRKNSAINRKYTPRGLYFDGYNFISRNGSSKGKISFTIDTLKILSDDLDHICKNIVCKNMSISALSRQYALSKHLFGKLLFNILDNTFDDPNIFKEYPISRRE